MPDPERERLVDALAQIYRCNSIVAIAVASVCDTSLDRSGRLLGEVRNKARALAAYDAAHKENVDAR